MGYTLARAPEHRETQIRAGERISSSLSVTISLNLGAYAGRLDNLNLAGIDNPSPNLTTMYLDTPLVGPTPEPLEYVPSPGRLGRPRGYPPSSTGPQSDIARRRPLPPPPPYNTHPRMRSSIGRMQLRRVVHATGLGENSKMLAPRGNPWKNFGRQLWRGLTSPSTLTSTGGWAGTWLGDLEEEQRAKKKIGFGS